VSLEIFLDSVRRFSGFRVCRREGNVFHLLIKSLPLLIAEIRAFPWSLCELGNFSGFRAQIFWIPCLPKGGECFSFFNKKSTLTYSRNSCFSLESV